MWCIAAKLHINHNILGCVQVSEAHSVPLVSCEVSFSPVFAHFSQENTEVQRVPLASDFNSPNRIALFPICMQCGLPDITAPSVILGHAAL